MYYWYGNPYKLDIMLFQWNDYVIHGNDYKLIERFMTRKDLFKQLNVDIYTYPLGEEMKFSFSLYNTKEDNVIKVDKRNPIDEIENSLKMVYNKKTDVTLSVVYNNIENKFIQKDFLEALGKLYHCKPHEIKEILGKLDKKYKFLKE